MSRGVTIVTLDGILQKTINCKMQFAKHFLQFAIGWFFCKLQFVAQKKYWFFGGPQNDCFYVVLGVSRFRTHIIRHGRCFYSKNIFQKFKKNTCDHPTQGPRPLAKKKTNCKVQFAKKVLQIALCSWRKYFLAMSHLRSLHLSKNKSTHRPPKGVTKKTCVTAGKMLYWRGDMCMTPV